MDSEVIAAAAATATTAAAAVVDDDDDDDEKMMVVEMMMTMIKEYMKLRERVMDPDVNWQEVIEMITIKYIVCIYEIFEELIKCYIKSRMFHEPMQFSLSSM